MFWAGLGAVLGHNFPFYLGFRGGKGIAASAGMLLAMDWRVFLICAVIFIGLVAITRYVSLGSMAAYAGALVCFIGFGAVGSYGMDFPHTLEMDVIMGLMTALAIYRHRANIYRLLNGTENKLGAAKMCIRDRVSQGVMILERNYRNWLGEIDLIGMTADGWLIFVEVKYRSSERSGSPLAAVNGRKQLVISKVAVEYLKNHYRSMDVRLSLIHI